MTQSQAGCAYSFFNYDAMGRVTGQGQAPPVACTHWLVYPMPYTYDLMGNLTSSGDGFWGTISLTRNLAARVTAASASMGSTYGIPWVNPFIQNAHYDAAGQLISDTLGDGETESFGYDNRGHKKSSTITFNGSTVYSFNITSFAPNDDVLAVNDTSNGNWTYGYDAFNRLVCANLSNGTCTSPTNGQPTYNYVYDRFGNRWQQNGPHSFLATFTGNNPSSPANNNRIDGYTYDSAGNLMNDGTHSYTYDAENRVNKVDGGSTATYTYDAFGNRVERTGVLFDTCDNTGIRDYVFDLSGHWILQVNSNEGQCHHELFIGSRHVAFVEGLTRFTHADWQGTERERMYITSSGQLSGDSCSSLPFGDALSCTGSPGNYFSTLHFTAKERDAESGLDNFGARYNSSSMGRFMSPDSSAAPIGVPYADFSNPQSLNLYAYVKNNPLNAVDADGHCEVTCWVTVAVAGYLSYKAGEFYYHRQEFKAAQESYEADTKLLPVIAMYPTVPGTANIDLDVLTHSIMKDQAALRLTGTQVAADEVGLAAALRNAGRSALSGSSSSDGGVNAEKAMGAGLKVGTKGVRDLVKATEQQPSEQKQNHEQQQAPTPQPPPPPPTCAGDQKKPCQ